MMITPQRVDENSPHFDDIVKFHASHLPKSGITTKGKKAKYGNKSLKPVVIILKADGKVFGLLEAYTDRNDPTQKILDTIIVDEQYQGKKYSRALFDDACNIVKQDKEIRKWIVHFRDSNKDFLVKVYSCFGFTDLKLAATRYNNGEKKWEMKMEIKD